MKYQSIISTNLILKAIDHYSNLGYELIDVPQCVDIDVSSHTKPNGVEDLFHTEDLVYVASAEQSFIQMHKDNHLKNGKYMALTPCYRDEKHLDNLHYHVFLKLELMVVGSELITQVTSDVQSFFKVINFPNKIIKTSDGFDIVSSKGTEVGSYGVRKMLDETYYVYGTGIAEPRLSYTKSNDV